MNGAANTVRKEENSKGTKCTAKHVERLNK
jgi:hypothetical protein